MSGLKCWKKEEINFLKENYGKLKPGQLSKHLGRSSKAVDDKRRKLGIPKVFQTDLLESYNFSEGEKGYLAGLIDGEGNLSIYWRERSGYLRPGIFIGTTNREAMQTVANLMKANLHKADARGNRRTLWRVALSDMRKILPLLEAIKPYLIVKSNHATILIEYCKLRLGTYWRHGHGFRPYQKEEIKFYDELKKLNTRGLPKNDCQV